MNLHMKKLACAVLLSMPLAAGAKQAPVAAQPASASAQADGGSPVAADATRLLPLQGVLNARTFEGLQGKDGPIPADSFVRTADLSRLTQADRDALAASGVTLDVDLRTAEEEGHSHDLLADDDRFKYSRISLLGSEKLEISDMPATLGELYVKSLENNKAQFRQVFQTIAAQKTGTVLFHCTAGKDRTGMVAATLLSLASVPRNDIVHNYTISAHYLKPMMSSPQILEMMKKNPQMAGMAGTPPEAIGAFLDALHDKHGGARAYLTSIGLSEAEVQSLLVRLGQSG